jgi:hypothetical protein
VLTEKTSASALLAAAVLEILPRTLRPDFHPTVAAQAVSETSCKSGGRKTCKLASAAQREIRIPVSTVS